MINKKEEKKTILFDEIIIGTNPFAMKELILRGYRVMAVSPTPAHETLSKTKNTQVRELTFERRS